MDETPIEKMKRKIVALLRHSKGTNNLKEAASFAAKARELMEEYAIEVAPSEEEYERVGETAIEDNQLGMTWFNTGYKSEPYIHLIGVVADYYGCHPVYKRGELNRVRIYGRESARITCCVMFKFFLKECDRLAQQWHEEKGWAKKEAKIDLINGLGIRLGEINAKVGEPRSHLPTLVSPISEAKALDTIKGYYFTTKANSSLDGYLRAGAVPLDKQASHTPKQKLGRK